MTGMPGADTGAQVQTGTAAAHHVRSTRVEARYFPLSQCHAGSLPPPSSAQARWERPQRPPTPESNPTSRSSGCCVAEATVATPSEEKARLTCNNDGYYALPSGTVRDVAAAIKPAIPRST